MQIISKPQLKQLIDHNPNFLLIDTLPKESFQNRHIPGAINIPFKDNPDFVDAVRKHVASKDQQIVVYCANTQCTLSKQAAQKLESTGFTKVQAFEEGLDGWFAAPGSQAA